MKRAAEALGDTPAGERGEEEPPNGVQHDALHEESEPHAGACAEVDALLCDEELSAGSAPLPAEDEEGCERSASTSPAMVPASDVRVLQSEEEDSDDGDTCCLCDQRLAGDCMFTVCCSNPVHPKCFMRMVATFYEDDGSDDEDAGTRGPPTCAICDARLKGTSLRRLLRPPGGLPAPRGDGDGDDGGGSGAGGTGRLITLTDCMNTGHGNAPWFDGEWRSRGGRTASEPALYNHCRQPR